MVPFIKGATRGNVTARAISVEKGGIFSGQLVIGQPSYAGGIIAGTKTSGRERAGGRYFGKRTPAFAGDVIHSS